MLLRFGEAVVSEAALVGEVFDFRAACSHGFLLPCVGGVAVEAGLVAMHEAGQFLAVVGVGGSDGAAVDKPRFAVGADVQFHAEVPLPTFFGGVHFGVAGFVGVFGGAGCGDDGGVYNGAVGELESCVEE